MIYAVDYTDLGNQSKDTRESKGPVKGTRVHSGDTQTETGNPISRPGLYRGNLPHPRVPDISDCMGEKSSLELWNRSTNLRSRGRS